MKDKTEVERKDNIAWVLTPRGWSWEDQEDIVEVLNDLSRDKEVRVVVFAGKEKHFGFGVDMKPGTKGAIMHGRYETEGANAIRNGLRYHWQRISRAVWSMEKPTISMIRGWWAGEHLGLALPSDLRIGSETSKFVTTASKFSTFNYLGEWWFLLRHIGLSRTMQLYMMSEPIDGAEAYRIGLLNWLVADDQLEAETERIAKKLASFAPIALTMSKLLIHRMIQWDLDSSLEMLAASAPNVELSEDHHEAVSSWMENREPKQFKGK